MPRIGFPPAKALGNAAAKSGGRRRQHQSPHSQRTLFGSSPSPVATGANGSGMADTSSVMKESSDDSGVTDVTCVLVVAVRGHRQSGVRN